MEPILHQLLVPKAAGLGTSISIMDAIICSCSFVGTRMRMRGSQSRGDGGGKQNPGLTVTVRLHVTLECLGGHWFLSRQEGGFGSL